LRTNRHASSLEEISDHLQRNRFYDLLLAFQFASEAIAIRNLKEVVSDQLGDNRDFVFGIKTHATKTFDRPGGSAPEDTSSVNAATRFRDQA